MSDNVKSQAELRRDDILRKAEVIARRDTGMGATIAGAGVLVLCVGLLLTWRTSYGGVPMLRGLIALLGVVVGVGLVTWARSRYTQAVKDRKAFLPSTNEEDSTPENMRDAGLDKQAMGNHQVIRLCRVMYDIDSSLVPLGDKFSFDDDNNLVSYAFRSTTPGFFSTERSINRVYEVLNTILGQGWNITPNSIEDTITGDKRSSVPKLAMPKMWRVVHSRAEAGQFYPDFEVVSGISADGYISSKPRQVPHRLTVGATGGGKSVAVRAEIMQYLAAGFRAFFADGKGTDYAPFFSFPNVSAISTTLPEHVILIHKVASILDARRARSARSSRAGDTSWRNNLTPVLLVLDEFATVMTDFSNTYGGKNGGLDLIKGDIARILKVGREFRVHAIISTQGMQAKTLDTDWLENIPMTHSLGSPSNMTVNKAFPEQIQPEVRRLGGTISRKTPGRGLVTRVTEDGEVTADLYQSFWSYSPAETVNDNVPAELLPNWKKFKTQVCDAIPALYPREWVKLEYPQPDGGKDLYADYRNDGWVDLTKLTVKDLQALEPVALQDPETLQPVPGTDPFDPLSDSYLGTQPLDSGSTVIDI